MNGQFSSLVVRESEASLDMLQGADVLWLTPAGVHILAENQLVPNISARMTSGGRRVRLIVCGYRNGHAIMAITSKKIHITLPAPFF